MTGATTNGRFKLAMNIRSPRYGDRGQGQCGNNRGGSFNQGELGQGNGNNNRRDNNNNEVGKGSSTGSYEHLKKKHFCPRWQANCEL